MFRLREKGIGFLGETSKCFIPEKHFLRDRAIHFFMKRSNNCKGRDIYIIAIFMENRPSKTIAIIELKKKEKKERKGNYQKLLR